MVNDSHEDTQNNTKQQKLVLNSLKNVPTGPHKERQSDRLQHTASGLQAIPPIIISKDSPTSDPKNSPKDHL
jgi:hypothetical protein